MSAAQLTRFKCEWCGQKCSFVVEMFSRNLAVSMSCCAVCAETLGWDGWIDSTKAYERKKL